ncbi:MAG: beta-Ala-His dipeptidase [Halobacteriovoraceae bacterium]|jgi:dipeptidase D|nr:beta-Ala-His dipeptidase [Halobacteriovoraceae bacterium]
MKPQNYPQSPKHLWNIFYDFTQTPRPSKREEKITLYLENIAIAHKLKHVVDQAGNIIIYVPGKNGREKDDSVIIQNHIDMVTDALHDIQIDFNEDAIQTKVDGDWLKAEGTTLGADNGIGCAAALATIFDESLVHPPLELLFTVDEETGLNGALGLEEKYLSGKKMLNLDTEEWGSLYIGCAGGIDYELNSKVQQVSPAEGFSCFKLQVEGFLGGHSGVDIHEQRGNAIKFLAELLDEINWSFPFEIHEIRAGKAHNIIPRDAQAVLLFDLKNKEKLEEIGALLIKKWQNFLPQNDQNLSFTLVEQPHFSGKVLDNEEAQKVIKYLVLFPHGAHSRDLEDQKLVGVSNNLARFFVVNGNTYTQSSLRFFDREEVRRLEREIKTLGDIFGMMVENHSEYPSWKPVRKNSVLDLVKKTYTEIYHEKPEITAIHAGLECGILKDKIGPIEVVSFGPTIKGAHSPEERVYIPSVEQFWDLFKAVLSKI